LDDFSHTLRVRPTTQFSKQQHSKEDGEVDVTSSGLEDFQHLTKHTTT